jgi:hypothetical protein
MNKEKQLNKILNKTMELFLNKKINYKQMQELNLLYAFRLLIRN